MLLAAEDEDDETAADDEEDDDDDDCTTGTQRTVLPSRSLCSAEFKYTKFSLTLYAALTTEPYCCIPTTADRYAVQLGAELVATSTR